MLWHISVVMKFFVTTMNRILCVVFVDYSGVSWHKKGWPPLLYTAIYFNMTQLSTYYKLPMSPYQLILCYDSLHSIVAHIHTRLVFGWKNQKKIINNRIDMAGRTKKANFCCDYRAIKFQCSSLCYMTFTVVITIDFCNNNANWMKQMNQKWQMKNKIHKVRGKRLTICFIVMQNSSIFQWNARNFLEKWLKLYNLRNDY